MPSYVNPPGAPPVMFAGPVQYTRMEIATACRAQGGMLRLPAASGLVGAQVLWALAGVESGFGVNCKPRHEAGYCTGRYAANATVQALTKRFGHAAHASFGPWQLMLVNLGADASLDSFATASDAAEATVRHINSAILRDCDAITLDQIADAYNSGSYRDANVPTEYIAKVKQFYSEPMVQRPVMPVRL